MIEVLPIETPPIYTTSLPPALIIIYNMITRIPKKQQENWNPPVKDKFQHLINKKKTILNKANQNHIISAGKKC